MLRVVANGWTAEMGPMVTRASEGCLDALARERRGERRRAGRRGRAGRPPSGLYFLHGDCLMPAAPVGRGAP